MCEFNGGEQGGVGAQTAARAQKQLARQAALKAWGGALARRPGDSPALALQSVGTGSHDDGSRWHNHAETAEGRRAADAAATYDDHRKDDPLVHSELVLQALSLLDALAHRPEQPCVVHVLRVATIFLCSRAFASCRVSVWLQRFCSSV